MTILLVLAILVLGGQTTACVEWMIANPPIIFGKTAQLSCVTVTPSKSSTTNISTSWFGGKSVSAMTFNGTSTDRSKYAEIKILHRSKFESILEIYKFDEMDVNVNYSCSIGICENGKNLSLTPDKFEYHPDKDTTTVLTSFRNGYLDVVMDIIKVYPIPKCTIMSNENIISQGLTTKTGVSGIFYIFVVVVEHYFDVCSSQLSITCVVGKTDIPIHQETFNKCTKTKEEESPENIVNLRISISILVLLLLILAMGCLLKYRQLKDSLCCNFDWGRMDTISQKYDAETANSLMPKEIRDSTHRPGQVENHEMMYLPSLKQYNNY